MDQALEIAYLDTHIAVWLAQGAHHKLGKKAAAAINDSGSLLVSPVVLLELEYLYEVGRIKVTGSELISHLGMVIDLQMCRLPMGQVMQHALGLKWTREPFDRMIVAHAAAGGMAGLITADEHIRQNYPNAIWE